MRSELLDNVKARIKAMYSDELVYPLTPRGKELFIENSYQQWAAREFLNYISTSNADLYSAADQFVRQMDDQATNRKGERRMFAIAYDVAVDLADQLYL